MQVVHIKAARRKQLGGQIGDSGKRTDNLEATVEEEEQEARLVEAEEEEEGRCGSL